MTAKTRSRRIRDQRKHLRAMGILLIVMAVFCVTAIGSLQLNQTYQNREAALEKQIADETERSKEIEDLETYTKTKKYVEDVAKEKLGLVYEDEILFKASGK